MTNPIMVFSYRYYSIDLPVSLFDCQVKGFPSRLQHGCQGGYVLLNYIDFEGAERKICRNCVEKLREPGKSETLKKVEYSTVYGANESEEGEE